MKVVLFANTDWYLFNFRTNLATALHQAGHDVLLVSPSGPYAEKLREMGFRWLSAPMLRRSLNPLREVRLILWLRDLLREQEVDLIHGFTIKCVVYGSIAARLAARENGLPHSVNAVDGMGYVYTSNDLKARSLRPIVSMLLRVALNHRGARLILQNPADVALFHSANLVDRNFIRLIPGTGVDCGRFVPAATSAVATKPSPFRVLLAARLLWDKGLAEYIDAAREIRKHGHSIEFLLAGKPDSGNPASVDKQLIDDWMSRGLVRWLGHVDDMASLLRTTDVVVLPSYREGLPKGLIEAAACGLPIITTDVPGCRDVVSDEIDGLLIPVRDASALARAILRLYEQPLLRVRLGEAARAKALSEFDDETVVDRTFCVYRELLPGI